MIPNISAIDALILGILQGLTEFLPISSSGHLIVVEKLLKLNPEMLKSFDVSVHFGTLLAIIVYFRKDITDLLKAAFSIISDPKGRKVSHENKEKRKLLLYLVIGTIPAVVVGLLWGDLLDELFRNPVSVAMLFVAVGLAFILIEFIHRRRTEAKIDLNRAIVIGAAQAIALIPGVSRSGATICAGLAQGVKREESARFSFLLGSVAIAAATALSVYQVAKGKVLLPEVGITMIGVVSSFLSGLLAITFLMKFLKKHSLNIFGYYRIIVGAAIILLMWPAAS
ncbi:MAG TPA: undecaprenyl-diphosphatase UppP [Candidatus Gracilibacteria bacterium]|nr:undecaprenyl-diphosphatase UppP [Candidatus Gracilibacteria bacterium]